MPKIRSNSSNRRVPTDKQTDTHTHTHRRYQTYYLPCYAVHKKSATSHNLTMSCPDTAAIFVGSRWDRGWADCETFCSSWLMLSRFLESDGSSASRRSKARCNSSSSARASDNVFSAWHAQVYNRTYTTFRRLFSRQTWISHSIFCVCSQQKNKKHLKNVGPIRHCEPLHCHSPGVATVARCAAAHRCPQRRWQQQQRVTGMDRYGPIEWAQLWG